MATLLLTSCKHEVLAPLLHDGVSCLICFWRPANLGSRRLLNLSMFANTWYIKPWWLEISNSVKRQSWHQGSLFFFLMCVGMVSTLLSTSCKHSAMASLLHDGVSCLISFWRLANLGFRRLLNFATFANTWCFKSCLTMKPWNFEFCNDKVLAAG